MRVTIRDVAARAGVSHATVSFVLNGKHAERIPSSTRTLVRQVAKDLGYQPNHSARSMSRGRTNIVGIVFPHGIRKPWYPGGWYAQILNAVTDGVNDYHQNLLLYTDQDYSLSTADTSSLTDHRCDGLLLFGFQLTDPLLNCLTTAGVPFVLVNNMSIDPLACSVDIDNEKAAVDLTRYLLDRGHKHIAAYGLFLDYYWSELRVDACRQTLREAGLDLPPENYLRNATSEEIINREAVIEMLHRPASTRPTAIMCTTDELALQLLRLLHELNISVPADMSIVGFDNLPESQWSNPPLTTINQPLREIGYRSVEILLGRVSGTIPVGYKEVLPTTIVERASVASL